MARVSCILADGFEEIEGLTVVDLLRRAQIDVNMVSITGKLEVTGSHEIKIIADSLFHEEDFNQTDMIVLPGGMPGTKHLGEYEPLIALLKDFNEKAKYIAAICAAPSVLGMNGLLTDKKAISYPGFYDKLVGATIRDEKVVVDGNIITSKGLGTSIDFALALIRILKDEEVSLSIGKSIQYM